MKRTLVTSGAGYVGLGLLREMLLNNYKLTSVDNLIFFGGESLPNSKIKYIAKVITKRIVESIVLKLKKNLVLI